MQPNPKADTSENGSLTEGRTERRKRNIPAATDRRKHDVPEVEDGTVPLPADDEATSFKKAMDRYKRENRRPFPTWSEVLEVLRSLGYRKVAEETEMPGKKETAGPPPAKG